MKILIFSRNIIVERRTNGQTDGQTIFFLYSLGILGYWIMEYIYVCIIECNQIEENNRNK